MVAAPSVTRPLRFLSPEQVVAIHDTLLRRTGGLGGGGHRGESYEGVDAAVQAVKNSYYERVEELAAAYAVYIVQGHVFADGNKRTGAAAMLTFLEANGRRTELTEGRLAAMMVDLQRRAESGEDAARLIQWIARALAERRRGSRAR
ncbi:MAG TPA: type II toxin-antitoxin system death-on-curing family toxin [Candidatus Rokubacteria bacterium]|nr:type II toxin-antitoxin system death-on-curing family toxin [Candidatus Rokubacteria bacterium]